MDFQYGNYGQAIGFGGGLLSGLRPGGTPAQSAAYGMAMQGDANMALNRANENMAFQQQQAQNESQQRMASNQNKAQRAGDESQERLQRGSLANRQKLFNIGQRFGYAQLGKQRQTNIQQSVLNGLAQEG